MAKNNLTPTMSLQHGTRIDEVVLNALAFSTLLSSQETDAHHQIRSHGPPGQPLNFTRSIPPCQLASRNFLLADASIRFAVFREDHSDVFDYTRDLPAARIGPILASLRWV